MPGPRVYGGHSGDGAAAGVRLPLIRRLRQRGSGAPKGRRERTLP